MSPRFLAIQIELHLSKFGIYVWDWVYDKYEDLGLREVGRGERPCDRCYRFTLITLEPLEAVVAAPRSLNRTIGTVKDHNDRTTHTDTTHLPPPIPAPTQPPPQTSCHEPC